MHVFIVFLAIRPRGCKQFCSFPFNKENITGILAQPVLGRKPQSNNIKPQESFTLSPWVRMSQKRSFFRCWTLTVNISIIGKPRKLSIREIVNVYWGDDDLQQTGVIKPLSYMYDGGTVRPLTAVIHVWWWHRPTTDCHHTCMTVGLNVSLPLYKPWKIFKWVKMAM